MKSDYDNFVDYWKDVRFAEEPDKMEIKENLKITGYSVKRGDQVFRFDENISEIPFHIGVKFLVLGQLVMVNPPLSMQFLERSLALR